MDFALGPEATASGYRLAAYTTIGSTSTEAMVRARAGDPGRLWVASKAQTAGHGRRGSAWQTASGNLAASLLLIVPAEQARSATLGFAAGLALDQAIRVAAPKVALRLAVDGVDGEEARLRLKWPNDVLVDGAKVAGILLEAVTMRGGVTAVVIGIGVNVLHAPEDLPYPATSLAACGADVTAEQLFTALAEAWVAQAELWDEGRGFFAVRRRWLERAAGLGAPIAVRLGEAVVRGTFETIDEEGMLVVRTPEGAARKIASGEVHFGAAATVRR
ncbi:MAG TPA: biotin--[acetyl-CoA-carboxylase] ligase [Propylenella sp.]|nr:biotin--[acetyl-CoA-carboxylase] ligase [Propylenella sp.]